jgi:hypothetical protein
VPFFFKQWGGKNKKQAGRVLERRVWNEMPQDARVKSISLFTHESLWHGQMV